MKDGFLQRDRVKLEQEDEFTLDNVLFRFFGQAIGHPFLELLLLPVVPVLDWPEVPHDARVDLARHLDLNTLHLLCLLTGRHLNSFPMENAWPT